MLLGSPAFSTLKKSATAGDWTLERGVVLDRPQRFVRKRARRNIPASPLDRRAAPGLRGTGALRPIGSGFRCAIPKSWRLPMNHPAGRDSVEPTLERSEA